MIATVLREVLGIRGFHDSEIDDSDERESLIAAVEAGDVQRETLADESDFLRVVAYQVPGADTTRYAVHRVQGDGLTYINDSDDLAAVESAYEEAVRDLEDCGPDGGSYWTATDVPGVPIEQPEDLSDDGEDEEDEDEF